MHNPWLKPPQPSNLRVCISCLACTVLPILFSVGCSVHLNKPPTPSTIGSAVAYSTTAFKADLDVYEKSMSEHHYDDARVQRDGLIGRIEVDVEADYRKFVGQLSSERAAINTLSDVAELGLSAAIGVTSGTDVKDILAASLTGFKGSRLSFDKNFFREKTTEVLISQMEASREAVRNRITSKAASMDARQYTFEEAWRDLVEFFYAGTLESALVELNNQAGASAANEKAQAKAIDIGRANSAEEADAAVRIRGNYARLYADAMGSDQTKSAAAVKIAKDVLITLGEGRKASTLTTPEDVMRALRDEIRKALEDPTLIPKLDRLLTPGKQ